ncbi:stress responsive A/B barrel domain-containing protein [Schizothecium vesticola]|uniref:Stress responsive A/B barrel domain-containing protein n=1 Tax=Schizothecium vesticola TaxID=314040 RepID=A0AA40F861_9PEZI|nr:stress responsive A/B barrel domain-containing protein [Schizothecium vesticola]
MASEGTVTHIVMFQFRDGVNRDVMAETASRMYALKDGCVHPYTGVPYISSVTDNVPAEVTTSQNTHAFAVRFRTASEREYFLKHDRAHLDLQKDVSAFVERVTMFDYPDNDELSVDRAYSKA